MIRYFLPLLLSLPVFLFCQTPTDEGQTPAAEQIVNLLYTLEGLQLRLGNAIDNSPEFADYEFDPYLLRCIAAEVSQTALTSYVRSINNALANLSSAEMESLLAVLQSPAGEVVKKVFALDNAAVERDLAAYVQSLLVKGDAARAARDSAWFNKEYPFDLREVMDGEYNDFIAQGKIVQVIRKGNRQTETLNGEKYDFKIDWVNNSRYTLVDQPGNPRPLGQELIVNIYEIEGDKFRYIWLNPDGTYSKHWLQKTKYSTYEDEIKTFRWSQQDKYTSIYSSPLSEEEIFQFQEKGGHDFFATDKKFRVTANFTQAPDDQETIELQTSDGQPITYSVYGQASFRLGGENITLTLYQSENDMDEEKLFLPFRDQTSGISTYGGGRYIDLNIPTGDKIVIDFNKSYNPYCAYTTGYVCPVPPADNTIPLAIEAGIKAPE